MSFTLKKTTLLCDKYNINIFNQEELTITVKITNYNDVGISEQFEVYIDDVHYLTDITDSNGSATVIFNYSQGDAEYSNKDLNNIGNHTIRVNESVIRFNAYFDTDWNKVSYKTGFSNHSNDSTGSQYRVYNHSVEIRGWSTNTSTYSGNEVTFASIPIEYAPLQTIYGLMQGSGATKWLLKVNTQGELTIQRYGTTSSQTNVAINQWLITCIMYTI